MRIDLPTRPRRRLSLTSLIDVIFLLLLFFMLSSTFTRFAEIEVSGAVAGSSASQDRPDIIVRIDGDTWQVNGRRLGEEAAFAELARLEQAGAASALLTFGPDLTSQALVSALEAMARHTGLAVSVVR